MCILTPLGKGDGTDIIKIHLLINSINKMLTKPVVRQQNLLCRFAGWNWRSQHWVWQLGRVVEEVFALSLQNNWSPRKTAADPGVPAGRET